MTKSFGELWKDFVFKETGMEDVVVDGEGLSPSDEISADDADVSEYLNEEFDNPDEPAMELDDFDDFDPGDVRTGGETAVNLTVEDMPGIYNQPIRPGGASAAPMPDPAIANEPKFAGSFTPSPSAEAPAYPGIVTMGSEIDNSPSMPAADKPADQRNKDAALKVSLLSIEFQELIQTSGANYAFRKIAENSLNALCEALLFIYGANRKEDH